MTPRRLIEPARLAGTSMLRTQSDARLVDLVRAGHASAFEAIVQRYRKQLHAYCSRLLPASRAEDAVQQTFLKAYQAMISGDADLNLRPWLYRIAHNASLNLLRQNGWGHEQLDENLDGVQRPDQAFELRERLRSTVEAVNALPERQRNAVLLREVDGLSYEQIASALGVGDGAVRQLLHRARATLRAGLTALTPVGLVERLAAGLTSGGDPRVAELATGIGVGTGAVKLGAAVLATGAIATGAVAVPLHHSRHAKTARAAEASLVTSSPSGGGGGALSPAGTSLTRVDEHRGKGSGSSGSGSHQRGGKRHGHHHGSGSGGNSGSGSGERQGSSGRGGSDLRGDSGSGSGSGDRHGGDGGSGRRTSGGDDGGGGHSGSGGSDGSGGSGSGDTGSGGDVSGSAPLTADQPKQDSSGDGGGDPAATVPTGTIPQISDGSGKDGSDSGSGKDGS